MVRDHQAIINAIDTWADGKVRMFVVWLFVKGCFDLADIPPFITGYTKGRS